jgi:TonB-dependent SusC/RagA subfamily outer membrane receptor
MKTIIASLFFILIFKSLYSQEKYINGLVTTFDSIPLVGADIQVRSTKEIIKTDDSGYFQIKVSEKDKIRISAKGFISKTVKVEEKTKLIAVNLVLKHTENAKEYAIGYGYVKDAEKLNALSNLSNKDMNFSMYSNMFDLIRGRIPGVQIQGSDIIIRGMNSLLLSNAALIVVDGVICESSILSSLSPSQIKSINVLKDGGSSIYGSRGANGVVIIETIKGDD